MKNIKFEYAIIYLKGQRELNDTHVVPSTKNEFVASHINWARENRGDSIRIELLDFKLAHECGVKPIEVSIDDDFEGKTIGEICEERESEEEPDPELIEDYLYFIKN